MANYYKAECSLIMCTKKIAKKSYCHDYLCYLSFNIENQNTVQ